MDEGSAKVRSLQHAARQLPGPAISKTSKSYLFEQRFRSVPKDRVFVPAESIRVGLYDFQWQHDVFADRQPRKHGRILERHADAYPPRANLTAGNEDISFRWSQQARDELEDCGLAASGWPNHGDEIAIADGQIRFVQGKKSLASLTEPHLNVLKFGYLIRQ